MLAEKEYISTALYLILIPNTELFCYYLYYILYFLCIS